MGTLRREARTRTVGVLWQNVYCVLEVFYLTSCFWTVVSDYVYSWNSLYFGHSQAISRARAHSITGQLLEYSQK